MKIAVEGCGHGELDKIYETIQFLEKKEGFKVDLLLCCGDFQAVRNKSDLHTMAVPPKYRKLNTFYKYYSGEKKAPILTIFIGGNHEASNYLQELPYGGWVAPNIYYMGYATVIRYGGVRIGGLSGIYKGKDFSKGHYERPPYTEESKRSAYHVRNLEVFRLKQLAKRMDIFMSHDWPRGIYNYGNVNRLLQKKSFFREEVEAGTLGNPAAEELLHKLQPSYWFSAHLHVKFAAAVEHKNDDGTARTTKFLALDKCLPYRDFLQVVDIPHDESSAPKLELDPEWLAILKSTNHLLNVRPNSLYMPGPGSSDRWQFTPSEDELNSIKDTFDGDYSIPENFVKTAPAHDIKKPEENQQPPRGPCVNPQTELLCAMLDLTDPNSTFLGKDSSFSLGDIVSNPEEIPIEGNSDDDVHDDEEDMDNSRFESFIVTPQKQISHTATPKSSTNPAEISLDNDSDSGHDEGQQLSDEFSPKPGLSRGLGLNLPQPKLETFDASEFGLVKPAGSSTPSTGTDKSESSADTTSTSLDKSESSTEETINTQTSEPPRKKMLKRRNMALYQTEMS